MASTWPSASARKHLRLIAETTRAMSGSTDTNTDEARLAYDSMYAVIANSRVYRQIIRRAFPDLPEWLIPYSVSPSLALLERIAQALNVGPNSAFIDLACGLGGPGLWVCERTGASLVGVDSPKSASALQPHSHDSKELPGHLS